MDQAETLRTVIMLQPPRMVCGIRAAEQCALDIAARGSKRALFVTSIHTIEYVDRMRKALTDAGIETAVDSSVNSEPTVATFRASLETARGFRPDAVIGLGGGSALDVAKLVAALLDVQRPVEEFFGIGLLPPRHTHLICVPTTSGTGSEVSPNAILLDEAAQLKKGVVSPYLVPDAIYVDARLMTSMPAQVTAGTGMDALTHCIESFANKFAHPAVDVYALAGIRLLSENLLHVIRQPDNLVAREKMAIGSLYGGLCLGPVNTAAVHALSYPLGGRFHVPHGAANTLLLPHVVEFNIPAAPERYAAVAEALGVSSKGDAVATAHEGVAALRRLASESGIPMRLRDWNIPESSIDEMADSAMEVTRLLKNNLREVTREDAVRIYRAAY